MSAQAPAECDRQPAGNGTPPADLVPRLQNQGYAPEDVAERRRWVEERTGISLRHVGVFSLPGEQMRGNIENPVGAAQTPLGVAGPLWIHGEYAQGTFYVPTVGTVGGGTGLGTGRECLELLGCAGAGKARKFAEIVAATLLAGELSMGAAIASGEFVQAHETYGRNRPQAMMSAE